MKLKKVKQFLINLFIALKIKKLKLLMMDKEHFNTLELLKNDDKEFYYHGHNRIYQYIFNFMIIIISFKIFFYIIIQKKIFLNIIFYFLLFY